MRISCDFLSRLFDLGTLVKIFINVLFRLSLFVVALLVATVQFEQERDWVLWI
mgnify:CR=1 FL=1